MQNVMDELSFQLRYQNFDAEGTTVDISVAMQMARTYQKLENAVVVLSDLEENKSYIFYGKFSQAIGLSFTSEEEMVDSIWEDHIFSKIHPEDLLQKHLMELQFFRFVHKQPQNVRKDYFVNSILRMRNNAEWFAVWHRMFYVSSTGNDSTKLALCLYQYETEYPSFRKYKGEIVNTDNGHILDLEQVDNKGILTRREIEILQLIKQGKESHAIAELLSISRYTVSRHRQNILAKLKVKNSFQACQIATSLMLL